MVVTGGSGKIAGCENAPAHKLVQPALVRVRACGMMRLEKCALVVSVSEGPFFCELLMVEFLEVRCEIAHWAQPAGHAEF